MKIKSLLKFSILEVTRNKRIHGFLVLNLALGLVGYFLLQIFQLSLVRQSEERAQFVLGGDVVVSARHILNPADQAVWEKDLNYIKRSHFIGLFSMLNASSDSMLVRIGAFDNQYPLYGKFKLSDAELSDDGPRIWVDPEVADTLNLKLNDSLSLGEQKFIYSGVIVEDPSRLFRVAGFSPKVLIHQNYLAASQLLKPGATITDYWSYQLPTGVDLKKVKKQLEDKIKDPTIQIESALAGEQEATRVLKYFTDYLGLVALVSLSLCFLCGSYLLEWKFLSKKRDIAIYKTLGLSNFQIVCSYLFQNLIVSLLAVLIAVSLVGLFLPLMQSVLTQKFGLPIQLIFSWQAIFMTSIIALGGPVLMIFPQILRITELNPLSLFRNVQEIVRKSWPYYFWLVSSVVLFWLLAILQSHSVKIASLFTGSLIGLVLIMSWMNRLILFLMDRATIRSHWTLKYSIKGLTRKPESAALVFTTTCLATLVLSLLPHVKASLIDEIRPKENGRIPSLFLFDIQPEQVEPLRILAKKILQSELDFSPLVRARILKINSESYEREARSDSLQTREAEMEARFRNRGVNLTYQDRLHDSETIVQGSYDPRFENADGIPKVSLEKKYAERVGLKVGDEMTFDVQGLELKAQVGSLRQVRWTSFQPNFFVLFPTGVLEEAPQIFLTSVQNEDAEKLKEFRLQASRSLKNVSVVDVSKTVKASLVYIEQMALGLQLMAWLAVIVGLFVFVVLLNTQIHERLQEMNLLQILGAEQASVRRIILTQFVLLLTTAIVFGILSGLLVALLLIRIFFEINPVFDFQYIVLLIGSLVPICSVALVVGLRPLEKLNPMDLIRQA